MSAILFRNAIWVESQASPNLFMADTVKARRAATVDDWVATTERRASSESMMRSRLVYKVT